MCLQRSVTCQPLLLVAPSARLQRPAPSVQSGRGGGTGLRELVALARLLAINWLIATRLCAVTGSKAPQRPTETLAQSASRTQPGDLHCRNRIARGVCGRSWRPLSAQLMNPRRAAAPRPDANSTCWPS